MDFKTLTELQEKSDITQPAALDADGKTITVYTLKGSRIYYEVREDQNNNIEYRWETYQDGHNAPTEKITKKPWKILAR